MTRWKDSLKMPAAIGTLELDLSAAEGGGALHGYDDRAA
jgi:hypothetical protein